MIKVFDLVDSAGKPAAKQLGYFASCTYVYVQVFGPNTLRLACTEQELNNPIVAPLNGLQIVMADRIVHFRWKGALWGIGSAVGTTADFQFPGGQP